MMKKKTSNKKFESIWTVVMIVIILAVIFVSVWAFVSELHPYYIPSSLLLLLLGIFALINLFIKGRKANRIFVIVLLAVMLGAGIAISRFNKNHIDKYLEARRTCQVNE